MPDLGGTQEAHLVDRCRYNRATRVSHGRNAGTHIDQVHDSPAQDVADRVRVVRKGDVGVLRSRFSYRTCHQHLSTHHFGLNLAQWNIRQTASTPRTGHELSARENDAAEAVQSVTKID